VLLRVSDVNPHAESPIRRSLMPWHRRIAPVLSRPRCRRRALRERAAPPVAPESALVASPTGGLVIAVSPSWPLDTDLNVEFIRTTNVYNARHPTSEVV